MSALAMLVDGDDGDAGLRLVEVDYSVSMAHGDTNTERETNGPIDTELGRHTERQQVEGRRTSSGSAAIRIAALCFGLPFWLSASVD
eukprot:COSAG01_NODE_44595_length_417_cov_1.317610_1_plen_87_part_00